MLLIIFCHLLVTDTVDLRIKRNFFDTIMAVRRLEEEKKILVTAMHHHWSYIKNKLALLKEISRIIASDCANNDAMKGM